MLDPKVELPSRLATMQLLAFSHLPSTPGLLATLLDPQTPQSLQLQVVQTLGAINAPQLASILLSRWKGFSPLVRREVVDVLTRSTTNSHQLLDAIARKQIQRVEIERDKIQILLHTPKKVGKWLAGSCLPQS